MSIRAMCATFALGLATPAMAGDGDAKLTAKASAEIDLKAEVMFAIQLPTLAHEVRTQGITEADVKATIEHCKTEKLTTAETAKVFRVTVDSVKDKGPVENFGAFVQTKLAAGLRGKDLADAIHKEHKARGIGKGKKLGHDKDKDKGKHDDDGSAKAKGHDKDHSDRGKHLGHDKQKDKDKDKAKDKDPKGKAKGHDKAKGEPSSDKGNAKGKDKPKDKGKAKGKDKPKDKGKSDSKGKGK